MDISEAIQKRKSIRSFKPDPVSDDLLKQILAEAVRAPSWANTQPWEFVVANGTVLEKIKKEYLAGMSISRKSDIPPPPYFPEKYADRIRELDKLNRLNTKDDWDRRRVQNYSLYGAPVAIYIMMERDFYYQTKRNNVWALYDCGAVANNIMLLAVKYGLGTIALADAVVYPDILRNLLEIPESKIMVLGIAVGYPDWDHPLNQFRTDRETLGSIVTWRTGQVLE